MSPRPIPTTPADEHPLSRLRTTMAGTAPDSSLLGRVLAGYAVGQSALGMYRSAQKWVEDRLRYTVSVKSDDPIYPDVHDWLLSTMTSEARRALVARSAYAVDRSMLDDEMPAAVERRRPRLHLAYNDARPQEVELEGHKVTVAVLKFDEMPNAQVTRYVKPDEIMFTCRSETGQAAVLRHLEQLVDSHKPDRKPMLWMLSSWGSWVRRSDLPQRELDTVVLEPGQSERLVGDLERFLDAEDAYGRLGSSWHRGYLLHGPPGSGKTSFVRALATACGLDLWYAPLGDLEKDTNLLALVSEVRPRSMLLLEDVDSFHAAREREAEKGTVSMSGLLNALDGVATPHGLITVLTSNHPGVLDDALIRPGRIDAVEAFTLPDDARVGRMFEVVFGRPPRHELAAAGRTPADVMEIFKQHLGNPAAAEAALREAVGAGAAA